MANKKDECIDVENVSLLLYLERTKDTFLLYLLLVKIQVFQSVRDFYKHAKAINSCKVHVRKRISMRLLNLIQIFENVGVSGSKQRKSKPHTKTRGIDGITITEDKGVVNGDVNQEENGAYMMVSKKPCMTVKCIILIDVIICVILFGIWLGICRGISCTKSE